MSNPNALPELPKNLEVEQKLLSAMLMNKDVRTECLARLSSDDFFSTNYKLIFETMRDMDNRGVQIDGTCLIDELKVKGKLGSLGGEAAIIDLVDYLPVMSAPRYLDILLRESARRKVVEAMGMINAVVAEPPSETPEFIAQVQDIFLQATEQVVPDDMKNMPTVLDDLDERSELIREGKTDVLGVKSGYDLLDQLVCGFQPGQLIVVGARPSVGKSAFAINLAMNIAGQGTKVCLFSLEMSSMEIAERVVSMSTSMNVSDIRMGMPDKNQRYAYEQNRESIARLPIDVDDTPGITISEMRAKARRSMRGHAKGIIIVDYLQLINPPKGQRADNRTYEVGVISRGLKVMAKKLKVPIIALAQLSRQVENRAGKRPQLSDIRESGSIEQDADIVMFLDRSLTAEEAKLDGRPNLGEANLIVAKNRQGPVGDVRLVFSKECMSFYSLTDDYGNLI